MGVGGFWQDRSVTITAAADGSALGNPGPAGWAWYVNDDCWRAGGWPHGTNNQGELMAVLDLFRATAHMPGEDLLILCDSQYVINAVTKWMPGWKRKGWRKADGKPVLNVDLLKDIDQALVGRKYTFEWVRGHAGHELNEAADVRARAAATAYQQGVAVRQGPGFGTPEGEPPAGKTPQDKTQQDKMQPAALQPDAQPAATPARRPAARPQAAPAPAGQQELFGVPGTYDEPDLFSELEEEPCRRPGGGQRRSRRRVPRTRTAPPRNPGGPGPHGRAAPPGLHRNRQLRPDLDPRRHDDVTRGQPGRSRGAGIVGRGPAG